MTKDTKIEIRSTEREKEQWRQYAARAGHGAREFSVWVRRILNGDEEHPKHKNVRGR